MKLIKFGRILGINSLPLEIVYTVIYRNRESKKVNYWYDYVWDSIRKESLIDGKYITGKTYRCE